jgi:hypothetical protein
LIFLPRRLIDLSLPEIDDDRRAFVACAPG